MKVYDLIERLEKAPDLHADVTVYVRGTISGILDVDGVEFDGDNVYVQTNPLKETK